MCCVVLCCVVLCCVVLCVLCFLTRSYFPALSREQAEAYLQNAEAGTFLMRDSSKENCFVISLKQSQKILHLLILKRGRGYGVDPVAWKTHPIGSESFDTMSDLVSRLTQLKMLKRGLTVAGNVCFVCFVSLFLCLFLCSNTT